MKQAINVNWEAAKPILLTLAIGLGVVAACPATAQYVSEEDGFTFGLVAGGYVNSPFVGESSQYIPYPIITYRNGPFEIGTFGVSYDFIDRNNFLLRAGVAPRFSALAEADAPELAGIDREFTADVYLGAEYRFDSGFNVGAQFRQDITGEHDGQGLRFDLGYSTLAGKTGIDVGAGILWQSDDLANYVWGVFPSEALPGRPAYDVGDVVIPFLSLEVERPVTDRWSIFGSVRVDFLPDDVTDSPIIEEDSPVLVSLGAVFRY